MINDMLAIIIPKADDKLLGSLVFQTCKDFRVYLSAQDPFATDYESRLSIVHGGLEEVTEPLTCILEEGALPGKKFVARILRTARRHEEFNLYHVNVENAKGFPRKADAKKIFKLSVVGDTPAPLSSFIFRTRVLREKAVLRPDGSLDGLSTVLSCAWDLPARNVWRETLSWTVPPVSADPSAEEKRIREKLDLLRWSETLFGDDDYPLSVGDQLNLFARETAKLYPSYTADELKEIMGGFQVAQGAVRKMRAAGAIKNAIKERQKSLQA